MEIIAFGNKSMLETYKFQNKILGFPNILRPIIQDFVSCSSLVQMLRKHYVHGNCESDFFSLSNFYIDVLLQLAIWSRIIFSTTKIFFNNKNFFLGINFLRVKLLYIVSC